MKFSCRVNEKDREREMQRSYERDGRKALRWTKRQRRMKSVRAFVRVSVRK